MPKKGKEANAVNEFDDTAWNAAFAQMTEDRKEDDKGSVATKDAMAVIDKIFDDMKTRYFGHLDVMESSVEQFGTVSNLGRHYSHHAPRPLPRGRERGRRGGDRAERSPVPGRGGIACVLMARCVWQDVATVDEQLNKIKEQLGAPAEGVPPS